jgi:hypothetical protein
MKVHMNYFSVRDHVRRILQILFFLSASIITLQAVADEAPNNKPSDISAGFNTFINGINALSSKAITQPDFTGFIDTVFMALAIFLFVFRMYKYSLNASSFADVFTDIVLILIVKILILNYDEAVSAIWQIATGVAGSLQKGMIGNDDLFFAPQYLADIMSSITYSGDTWEMPFNAMKGALIAWLISGLMFLLSALSYVSSIFGFWGFTIAKLIGLLTVPTLLFQRLSFIFDGFLRFLFGFVIYYIIARLNLVLVACAVSIFFGAGLPPTAGSVAALELNGIQSIFEVLGLMTFIVVGILALFSTSKFAATIVSGAGGGGMGSAALGAARMVGKLAGG